MNEVTIFGSSPDKGLTVGRKKTKNVLVFVSLGYLQESIPSYAP